MRPHREAFSKHTVPMNPSDNVHKTVFKPGDTKKPSANANDGRHQNQNIFAPLHNTSRCFGPHALDMSLIFFRIWPNETRDQRPRDL
jgi:hypothetical protein